MVGISEKLFGEALTPGLREQLQIITKCSIKPAWQENGFTGKTALYDSSKANIIATTEQSLPNFKTDRLDLLLIHRPDYLMNVDEVAKVFSGLKKEGKVLHFGVTQFELLQSRFDFKLVTNQIEMSPLKMGALEDGTFNLFQQHQISSMLWSPLAGGGLFA